MQNCSIFQAVIRHQSRSKKAYTCKLLDKLPALHLTIIIAFAIAPALSGFPNT